MIIFSEQKAKDEGVGAVWAGCSRRDGQLRVTPAWAVPSPKGTVPWGLDRAGRARCWQQGPLTAPDEASDEPGPGAVQKAQ